VPGSFFDVSGTTEDPVVTLRVVVHPGAGRSSIVGQHGDALKLKVAAPPVDGRANQAVVELVAEVLGVPESRVSVVSGQSSRSKRLRVEGVDPDAVQRTLEGLVGRAGRHGHSGPPPGPRRI
jgi:uncharacterized protein (TIGR00251 family)